MSSSGVCGVKFHLPGGAVLFQSHPPPIVLCCWMFTVGVVGGTGELRPGRDWHKLARKAFYKWSLAVYFEMRVLQVPYVENIAACCQN